MFRLMKAIRSLLWIWPLPHELLTEQLEWKWQSAHSKVSHKDVSITFMRHEDEKLPLIILIRSYGAVTNATDSG